MSNDIAEAGEDCPGMKPVSILTQPGKNAKLSNAERQRVRQGKDLIQRNQAIS